MSGMTDPASNGFAVTPSDTTELTGVRGVYVGESGDLAVVMRGGTSPVTLVGVPAGMILPIRVTKIMATNTSAASIIVFT